MRAARAMDWTPADFGAAMVRYVEQHAESFKRVQDGVECAAFYRGGDNPSSLRVWESKGTWGDARAKGGWPTGGNCKDFAERIAGLSLPDFMETYGLGAVSLPQPLHKTPESTLPPDVDVRTVWQTCRPVTGDSDVCAWMREGRKRNIDPERVEERDLARALPRSQDCPVWMCFRDGRSWAATGHRVVVPLYDARGRLASLHARNVRPDAGLKSASPTGCTTRGLALADSLGQRMLAGEREAAELVTRVGVVIAEGAPDFLSWATARGDADDQAPAVLGVMSGTWTPGLADRLPDCTITIATDNDDAGDKYAEHIIQTLGSRMRAGHVQAIRWTP